MINTQDIPTNSNLQNVMIISLEWIRRDLDNKGESSAFKIVKNIIELTKMSYNRKDYNITTSLLALVQKHDWQLFKTGVLNTL